MLQKSGAYMHTQTALGFKFYLDVVARKDHFQKVSVTQQTAMTAISPKFLQQFVAKK